MTALLHSPKPDRLTGRAALDAAYKQHGVRKKRDDPEFRLTCGIAKVLRNHKLPNVVAFHIPNGEKRSAATGARLKAMGVERGAADFLVQVLGRPAGMLELKRHGGQQTDDQRRFERSWRDAGGLYEVADGWNTATAVLVAWGAIPDRDYSRTEPLLPLEAA